MKQIPLPKAIKTLLKKWWTPWAIGYFFITATAACIAYYWRVAFSLGDVLPQLGTSLRLLGVLTALYIAFFLISRFGKDNLCLKAALCVFILGIIFTFVTPPMQVPDEFGHYLRTHTISRGNLNYDFAREYPTDVSHFDDSFSFRMNQHVQYGMGQLAPFSFDSYQNATENNLPATHIITESYNLNIIPYLPGAIAMAIARVFGFGALGLMYAARIANVLCYAFISYFTFKNCDKYRGVFLAVAMLPLSVFMAASCSTDGLIIAASFLAVSYFCKKEIHTKDVIVFGIAVLVSAYLKPPNILLAAVILLIPKTRWKTKINPWLIALGTLAAFIVFYFGFEAINKALKVNAPPADPRGSGGASPYGQLLFVLQNPLRFLATLVLSFFEHNAFLFDLGLLGALDLMVPLVSGLSLVSLSAASALGIQQKEDTKASGAAALALGIIGFTGGTMLGLYLVHADVGSIRITGLQPRYFLCAILMLFMLVSIVLGKAVRPRISGRETTLHRTEQITFYIVFAVALFAAFMMFQSYFIGQWFVSVEGVWKLINMIGWVPT